MPDYTPPVPLPPPDSDQEEPTMTPTRKVTAAGLAGAITTVGAWILSATTAVEMPPEVAAAVTTILTVGTAYLVPENSDG